MIPAAVVGVLLERLLLGPALAKLAINYATLALGRLCPSAAGDARRPGRRLRRVAVAWVARQAAREPVVAGLAAAA